MQVDIANEHMCRKASRTRKSTETDRSIDGSPLQPGCIEEGNREKQYKACTLAVQTGSTDTHTDNT
jgi:hypothetical protein